MIRPRVAIERIADRSVVVDRGYATPCRIQTGYLNGSGYAQIQIGSKRDGTVRTALSHRVVWEHYHGPIPDGFEIDHLCKQRDCHEHTHLEVVTPTENKRRGDCPSGINARKTHCIHGHPLSGENLRIVRRSNGLVDRQCGTCRRASDIRSKAARRAREVAA